MPSVDFDDLVEDRGKVNESKIMNKRCKTKDKVKAPGRNRALELSPQRHNKIQLSVTVVRRRIGTRPREARHQQTRSPKT